VATGATVVVVGAATPCRDACWAELALVEVLATWVEAAGLVAVVAPGREIATAVAPRTPAAPAPMVIADTQISPLLRTDCRAEPGVAEPAVALGLSSRGRAVLCCSLFMRPHSTSSLCDPEVLPLTCL
jgi:hypothetical protein